MYYFLHQMRWTNALQHLNVLIKFAAAFAVMVNVYVDQVTPGTELPVG